MRSLTQLILARNGISEHMSSYADSIVTEARKESVAYCGSDYCRKDLRPTTKNGISANLKVRKNGAKRNAVWCRDCGQALFWKMEAVQL